MSISGFTYGCYLDFYITSLLTFLASCSLSSLPPSFTPPHFPFLPLFLSLSKWSSSSSTSSSSLSPSSSFYLSLLHSPHLTLSFPSPHRPMRDYPSLLNSRTSMTTREQKQHTQIYGRPLGTTSRTYTYSKRYVRNACYLVRVRVSTLYFFHFL